MSNHTLLAGPDTVRLGVFNAAFPPVMTVASGDTVTVQCVSGRKDVMPPSSAGFTIPPALTLTTAALSQTS